MYAKNDYNQVYWDKQHAENWLFFCFFAFLRTKHGARLYMREQSKRQMAHPFMLFNIYLKI